MNTSTFNTYNTNLRAVYFRDMRIYQTGCIPRYNVKKSEPTIICSLYLKNIHLSYDKRPPQKDRNTYKQKLYCLKISSSSNLNSFQFGLTHNNNRTQQQHHTNSPFFRITSMWFNLHINVPFFILCIRMVTTRIAKGSGQLPYPTLSYLY